MVKFIKKYKRFGKGDVATFSEKIEQRLIRLGYAEKYEKQEKKEKEVKEAPKDKMVKEKDTKKK
jgi:hypothetical protein